MSDFLASLFGGQNKTLDAAIPQFGQIGTSQVNQGQSNQNAASGFWNKILSGDATTQMQALSPEISAAKTSAANENKTTAMFGGRSGGTAAKTAATNDSLHGYITNLIGSLVNSSASNLASLGTSQISTGLWAIGGEVEASQQRYKNWEDSILGRGITTAVSAAETGALGAIGKSQNNNNDDDNS